jgi:hypothetical protein
MGRVCSILKFAGNRRMTESNIAAVIELRRLEFRLTVRANFGRLNRGV